MTVTLVVLTYNRAPILQRVMAHNFAQAGSPINELVWVDNGSTDGVHDVMMSYKPDVVLRYKNNVGVFKGYNRGFAVASGDFIVITDDDMLMPVNWLATFRTYLSAIPSTGVACILWNNPRFVLRTVRDASGLEYQPCYPIGRFIVRRDLLTKRIGYLREDFGLFGLGDIEWAHRAVRVCREDGLLCYALPGVRSEHLGTEECDGPVYRAYKSMLATDPFRRALLQRCRDANFPYYNPYA